MIRYAVADADGNILRWGECQDEAFGLLAQGAERVAVVESAMIDPLKQWITAEGILAMRQTPRELPITPPAGPTLAERVAELETEVKKLKERL